MPKSQNKRIARTEAYAAKVKAQFDATIAELVGINKSIPTLPDGRMFSFADLSAAKQAQVESILHRLHVASTLAIKNGMTAEWELANKETDKFLKTLFGNKMAGQRQLAGVLSHNETAMNAFINRTEAGMNLSGRVWSSVKQLRDEMEVAMTVSIGGGEAATVAALKKDVLKALNNPDAMFRRFVWVDKNGNKHKKWKKGEIDPATGKRHYVDVSADDPQFHPGRGVYRNASKNAMRLARTETNMAYRQADFNRWQKMPFVRGIRIELSKNHPAPDICNDLAGDYPKNFLFIGWHPQCFCHAKPITADEDDMERYIDAMLDGDGDIKPGSKEVTETPLRFQKWVKAHEVDIADPNKKSPYFIQKNGSIVDKIRKADMSTSLITQRVEVRNSIKNTGSYKVMVHEVINTLPCVYSKAETKIQSLEEKLLTKQNEVVYFVNRKGNVVCHRKGESDSSVNLNDLSVKELNDVKNGILTHNHPAEIGGLFGPIGGTFSAQDFATAMNFNLAEIRAVTPAYTYSLRRPSKGWPTDDSFIQIWQEAAGAWAKFETESIRISPNNEKLRRIYQPHFILKYILSLYKQQGFDIKYLKVHTRNLTH